VCECRHLIAEDFAKGQFVHWILPLSPKWVTQLQKLQLKLLPQGSESEASATTKRAPPCNALEAGKEVRSVWVRLPDGNQRGHR
jgi:hypothetical protein